MVARAGGGKVKASARRALTKSTALYLSDEGDARGAARARFAPWGRSSADRDLVGALPVYSHAELPQLISRVRAVHAALAA